MTHLRQGSGGQAFGSRVIGFCDRFLSQRTFELVVEPALADFEFEEAAGRRSGMATRAAVVRALLGGLGRDIRRGCGGFFKLALLSVSYFMFPVAVSGSLFKTWAAYLVAATLVLLMSMIPVMVCFWPTRYPVQPGE